MFCAAICDDEVYIADKIEKCVMQFGNENNVDFRTVKFYDGKTLINSDIKFDLIFL